ncbi:golgin subfamily A member 2-like, partial [Tupaia chinensis]|uniref:golgin subfamily A member 2-like n=1 Tax=Tupaia chinensis TaxID=246437 RepID=UPI0003C8C793
MEKLKSRFLQAVEEKAALQERVDALEDRCLQLAAETETIGDFIVLYQRQRAMLKERYKEKDEYIHQLLQEKENLKVKLLELQRLVSQLTGKESEDPTTFLATTQSPAEFVPGLPASQGFRTADQLGDCRKVSLADSVQSGQGKAGMGSPAVNRTTRPITQQKWKIQNTQE